MKSVQPDGLGQTERTYVTAPSSRNRTSAHAAPFVPL